MPTKPKSGEKAERAKLAMLSVLGNILLMFVCAQIIGFYSGTFIINDAKTNEIVAGLRLVSGPADYGAGSALLLLAYVLLGALAMYLLLKFYKGQLIFTLMEFAVIAFASSIVFYSLLKPFFIGTAPSMAVAIGLGLVFAGLKIIFPALRNLAAVISTAGAGAVFGFSLTFFSALLFLVFLSIYDYIAVFKTKHMVEMAESISKKGMSFVLSSRRQTELGEMRFELGTGDVLLPIVLAVSGFQANPIYAAVSFAASVCGLLALFVILSRKKDTLPALPIIAFFNFLFLGAYYALGLLKII